MKFIDFQVTDQVAAPDEKNLRHLKLSGRHGYHQQGYKGSSQIAGVIDTGVNKNHPELAGRVIGMLNYCGYGDGSDDMGHGTHVAATIAGATVGMAPEAQILSVKVLDGSGGGDFNNIIKACEDLKTWRSADGRKLTLVSMSLSAPAAFFSATQLARFKTAIDGLVAAGIAVICSAGNTGTEEVRYPAYFSSPITVGAVNLDTLQPAGFSTSSKEVDLCQGGVGIASAWYQGGYANMDGTSMATPGISGITLLIADKYYKLLGHPIPEPVLYAMLKMNTKDVGIAGVDRQSGVGFCSLQPVIMDLHTHEGNPYWTLNGHNEDLLIEIPVIPPGVTVLPLRATIERIFGGVQEWDPETQWARARV